MYSWIDYFISEDVYQLNEGKLFLGSPSKIMKFIKTEKRLFEKKYPAAVENYPFIVGRVVHKVRPE